MTLIERLRRQFGFCEDFKITRKVDDADKVAQFELEIKGTHVLFFSAKDLEPLLDELKTLVTVGTFPIEGLRVLPTDALRDLAPYPSTKVN